MHFKQFNDLPLTSYIVYNKIVILRTEESVLIADINKG